MQIFGTALMSDIVLVEKIDVETLFLSLDLDSDGLVDCVRYADAERALCNSNDVHGFASMTTYDKCARALRERYCVGGLPWEKDDTNNQAGIRHPGKKIRVVPCNFDEHAGDPRMQPTNRSPKGEVSKAKVRCNGTGWIPGLLDVQSAQAGREYQTWILGVYSLPGMPLKAELSFPVAFNGEFFTRFKPRAILLRGSEDMPPYGRRAGEGPTPTEVEEIQVLRKK